MLYVYFWEDCIYLVNFLALIENVVGASMFNWFISTSMPIWHSAPPPMVPSIEPSTTTVSGTSCTCSKIKHQLKELNIHSAILQLRYITGGTHCAMIITCTSSPHQTRCSEQNFTGGKHSHS